MVPWLGFERRVALRFLREGRMQTLLIIVGVAAGVAVVAYISALISGLQGSTLTKTLGAQAHLTMRAPDDAVTPARAADGSLALTETQPRVQRLRSVANWQALLPLLEQMDSIAAVSPMVSGSGLALRGEAAQAIALMGWSWSVTTVSWACAARWSAVRRDWTRARPSSAVTSRPTWACAWATA